MKQPKDHPQNHVYTYIYIIFSYSSLNMTSIHIVTLYPTLQGVAAYRVHKALRAGLFVLVDLVNHQEHHTHQEGQGTDHQQSHLERETQPATTTTVNHP